MSEPAGFPSFAEAVRVWFRVGCLSFGGPAGQIALMHREVVDERCWVSDARFLHALNFCTLLPGPEATQLATYLGWLLHGVKGGVAAGLLFVLPGAAVMLALSAIYAAFGEVPLVAGLFYGLKCAVLVLVIEALLRVARRALKGRVPWAVAGLAFAALFLLKLPFPAVVLAAGLAGYVVPAAFAGGGHGAAKAGPPALLDALLAAEPDRIARLTGAARRAGLLALVLWVWPVVMLLGMPVWGDIAWFFSKMAVVTFGGAYAVLAYVAQEAVENYRWLSAGQMLAGLGLAETTPGPLILVLHCRRLHGGPCPGRLLGRHARGAADPVGHLRALLRLDLPRRALCRAAARCAAAEGALAGVTAAVVGVIANLAVWFGLRVLFGAMWEVPIGPARLEVPILASIDPVAVLLAMLAAVSLFRMRMGVVKTLGIAAAAGLVLRTAFGWLLG
ncbi:chromate efflux transporter [Dankookia sp. P2]|uniref:chromate efflux transporter n=1 Tax=Dankookia sp. P2 TaxID=3423955 RepID=UPI003D671F53